jgi:hypothetical protein
MMCEYAHKDGKRICGGQPQSAWGRSGFTRPSDRTDADRDDALEAAVADPTDDNLDRLREAADKLMRTLSRVLIEVEHQRSTPMR